MASVQNHRAARWGLGDPVAGVDDSKWQPLVLPRLAEIIDRVIGRLLGDQCVVMIPAGQPVDLAEVFLVQEISALAVVRHAALEGLALLPRDGRDQAGYSPGSEDRPLAGAAYQILTKPIWIGYDCQYFAASCLRKKDGAPLAGLV